MCRYEVHGISAYPLNHEHNKCLIIPDTIQAMPTKFAQCCEDSPTKGLYGHCQSDDLDLHSRSQMHLKLYFLSCNI